MRALSDNLKGGVAFELSPPKPLRKERLEWPLCRSDLVVTCSEKAFGPGAEAPARPIGAPVPRVERLDRAERPREPREAEDRSRERPVEKVPSDDDDKERPRRE